MGWERKEWDPGMKKSLVACALVISLACGGDVPSDGVPDSETRLLLPSVEGISVETLLGEIEVLASDEFEGRGPGSEGEQKTIAYLRDQFVQLGAVPGNPDGTWVQDVPLVGITPVVSEGLIISKDGDSRTLELGVDYVATTKHVVDAVEVDSAEFVFVGYGARAPEYEWDDFGTVDVSGKILLFLVNDPPLDDVFAYIT